MDCEEESEVGYLQVVIKEEQHVAEQFQQMAEEQVEVEVVMVIVNEMKKQEE